MNLDYGNLDKIADFLPINRADLHGILLRAVEKEVEIRSGCYLAGVDKIPKRVQATVAGGFERPLEQLASLHYGVQDGASDKGYEGVWEMLAPGRYADFGNYPTP